MNPVLPVGKLPPELLAKIIHSAPTAGPRVLLGPGIGLDCAVLEFGESCLVLKTEPITFASEEIGWYAVQIAVNDIATTGARPAWAMFSVLLPEGKTTAESVAALSMQVTDACRAARITLIGGHTEVTHGLDRPIIVTTMLGEIQRDKLVTPEQARPGDILLLTKGVPIEATALLAREFPAVLKGHLTPEEIHAARNYLFTPGISILEDAQIAVQTGSVTAMHDPTEGGVATALWEMAQACQYTFHVDPAQIPIPPLSARICEVFGLDPLGTISSGALLLAVKPASSEAVLNALKAAGIPAAEIGVIAAGAAEVLVNQNGEIRPLPRFDRDEIGRVYQQYRPG